MKIGKHRRVTKQGYPVLVVEIDGKEAWITPEQKQKAVESGFIYLGINFEDDYFVIAPADPADGMPEPQEKRGYTDNEEVFALYQRFIKNINR